MDYFFKDEYVTLYKMDAVAGLPQLRPSQLRGSAILTDPRYNIGFDFGPETDDATTPEEYEAWSRAWLGIVMEAEAATVAFTPGIANLGMWYRIKQPDWQIAWVKANVRSHNKYEPVLIWGHRHGDDLILAGYDYEDDRIGWHPTPKPYGWGEGLILRTVTSESQKVIDPFTGSGTIPTSAARFGLHCIAFEVRELYCERMAKLWQSDEERALREKVREAYDIKWEYSY